jgi:hypothetical protein
VTPRRRIRLTAAAGVALVLFLLVWAAFLGSGQCGNADTVECTTLGWVLLYGWMALGLVSAGLLLLVAALWAAEAGRHLRRRGAR